MQYLVFRDMCPAPADNRSYGFRNVLRLGLVQSISAAEADGLPGPSPDDAGGASMSRIHQCLNERRVGLLAAIVDSDNFVHKARIQNALVTSHE